MSARLAAGLVATLVAVSEGLAAVPMRDAAHRLDHALRSRWLKICGRTGHPL